MSLKFHRDIDLFGGSLDEMAEAFRLEWDQRLTNLFVPRVEEVLQWFSELPVHVLLEALRATKKTLQEEDRNIELMAKFQSDYEDEIIEEFLRCARAIADKINARDARPRRMGTAA